MSAPVNWIGDEPSIVDAVIAALPLPGSNKLTSLGIALVGDAILASDWLKAHDVRVAADARADERERIALAIEAYGAAHPMGPNSRPFAAVARKGVVQ